MPLTVQHLEHLRLIKEAAVISPIAEGVQHSDDYVVMIQSSLERPSSIKAEHVNIRWCDVMWCAVLCCAVLCCAVLCCAVLCCAVLCCAVLCCAVLWYAVVCCVVLCCAAKCCAVYLLCSVISCCAGAKLYCSEVLCYHVQLYGRREGEAYFPVPNIDWVRHLDRNNIVIIGTVMAQTVALDHYAESVERMIVSFMRMNMKIEQSGNFDLLDKKDLYKLIASNNTVNTNVLSKVKPMHMHIHMHMYIRMHIHIHMHVDMHILILYLRTPTVLTNTYFTHKHVPYLQRAVGTFRRIRCSVGKCRLSYHTRRWATFLPSHLHLHLHLLFLKFLQLYHNPILFLFFTMAVIYIPISTMSLFHSFNPSYFWLIQRCGKTSSSTVDSKISL